MYNWSYHISQPKFINICFGSYIPNYKQKYLIGGAAGNPYI